jgi:RNA polymerase sigma-70 factor, ECF subfamily
MQQQTVTQLLHRVAASPGGGSAAAELLPIVYEELRALASGIFRDQAPGNTLQPTALVHEAYLKLVDQSIDWQSRRQFYAVAASAMRGILVDHARRKVAAKRGGPGAKRVPLSTVDQPRPALDEPTILAIDDAMSRLAELDERKAKLVELRFFAGLTSEEAAEALGIARSTAAEEWRVARAWLYNELQDERA